MCDGPVRRSMAFSLRRRRAGPSARRPGLDRSTASTSMSRALNTTGPSPTSKRVGRPVRKRGRTVAGSKPMTLSDGPGHAQVADVGRAARQDPLVGGRHVGVGADDGADAPVEMDPEARSSRSSARSGSRPGGPAGSSSAPSSSSVSSDRERVLDGLHVGPALGVDDRHLGAVGGVEDAPAAARHAGLAVVQRPQDALARGRARR